MKTDSLSEGGKENQSALSERQREKQRKYTMQGWNGDDCYIVREGKSYSL